MISRPRCGVLFDVDGTLVDSTYLHTTSWWQALREFGLDVSMARIHRAIGMGSDHLLDHLVGEGRDRGYDGRINEAHAAIQATFWSALRPTRGATDLLTEVARRGLYVVLASSAAGRELAALRRCLDADDAIDIVATADDAGSSKPAPDVIQVALAKAGLTADRAVFVGDAVWDAYACQRAGLPCVGVTCGGTSRAELLDAGAVAVYDDPAALLSAFDDTALAHLNS